MSHLTAVSLSMAVVLLGSSVSLGQTSNDQLSPDARLPRVRVTADPAQVSNGNPGQLRGTIVRSFAAVQRCAAQLPAVSAPTTVRANVQVVIPPAASQVIVVNVRGVGTTNAFDACARAAVMQLPWPRVERGATQVRWSYAIELAPSGQPEPQPQPQVTVNADPATVVAGNPGTIRGLVLRSYVPVRACAANLPRQAGAYRVGVELVVPSVADQAITATVRGLENSPAVVACMQQGITQLPWPRLPRDTTRAQWTYSIEVR